MFNKDYFVIQADDKEKFDEHFATFKTWYLNHIKPHNYGMSIEEDNKQQTEAIQSIDALINKYNFLDLINKTEHTTTFFQYMIEQFQDFFGPINQSQELFDFTKALTTHDHYDEVVKERALESFAKNGFNLSEADKETFNELKKKITQLKTTFSKNIIDSKKEWKYELTDDIKATLSEKELSQFKEVDGKLVLSFNSNEFSDILTESESSAFRKIIYDSYNFIASANSSFDNTAIIHEIIEIRNKQAELLGEHTYANHTLKNRMGKNFDNVNSFLVSMKEKIQPYAKKDLAELYTFIKEHYNKDSIDRWDIGYYANKKQEHILNYKYNEERQYFPEKEVFEGSFKLIESLFGFTFEKDDNAFNLPYEDTVCYKVFENGVLKSYVVIDLYERPNKNDGAWVSGIIPPTRDSVGLISLNCTFNKKDIGLDISEITTFLHEFGHAIHHFSSSTKYEGLAGTSGMAWDAVEIPSQMLEQFAYNKEFLKGISSHYKTGEKIPDSLIDTLIASKNYGIGGFYTRQLAFALFDINLHNGYTGNITELYKEIANSTLALPVDEGTSFPNTFSHIFSGGYSAGYYGYLWSDLYSINAYSYIIEDQNKNALKFKSEFLTHGSSKPPEELYENFSDKGVDVNKFLNYYGIS